MYFEKEISISPQPLSPSPWSREMRDEEGQAFLSSFVTSTISVLKDFDTYIKTQVIMTMMNVREEQRGDADDLPRVK